MPLGMLPRVKQETTDRCREPRPADRSGISKRRRIGAAQLIDSGVERRGDAVDQRGKRRTRRRRRFLRVARRFLRVVQPLASGGGAQAIGRADEMNEVEANRRRSARSDRSQYSRYAVRIPARVGSTTVAAGGLRSSSR